MALVCDIKRFALFYNAKRTPHRNPPLSPRPEKYVKEIALDRSCPYFIIDRVASVFNLSNYMMRQGNAILAGTI